MGDAGVSVISNGNANSPCLQFETLPIGTHYRAASWRGGWIRGLPALGEGAEFARRVTQA